EAGRQQRGPYRIFPVDTAHNIGWAGFILFVISAAYSALKRGFPSSIKLWLGVHCAMGILSILLVAFHIINKIQRIGPQYFISFFAFFLMLFVVFSGILGRYVRIKIIKDYWRTLHVPITIIFVFVLAVHMLEKMGFLF
ncbi:MAG: hypothetical protein QXN56_05580, partial [Candidatus Hadarchaeum sp.]